MRLIIIRCEARFYSRESKLTIRIMKEYRFVNAIPYFARGKSYLLALLSALVLSGAVMQASTPQRIVSTNGTLTEVLYFLDALDLVVGVDSSSVFPEQAQELPVVGYSRALSAEGILSLNPDLIFLSEDAGPPPVVEQVRSFGIPLVTLTSAHTVEGTVERIRVVGEKIGRSEKAEKVIAELQKTLEESAQKAATLEYKPKVLFLYSRAGGTLNVAGDNTAADDILELSGAENAIDGFEGYKPLTAEAAVVAAPDFILFTSRGLEAAGGIDAVLQHPGLSETPAGKNRKVVAVDDLLLLGFGPRLGEAVTELVSIWSGKSSS